MISCSTRKDRFLNRAVHTTTTKYNVMYNGILAYETAKKELDDSYVDDFSTILPIEPLKINEVIGAPFTPKTAANTIDFKKEDSKSKAAKGIKAFKNLTSEKKVSAATGFKRAEEKAVKSVQKHSMNFSGNEKNKQIDDAYLLLGKARYYDQRFVPALETFVYITKHYSKSPLLNEAKIWEARCLNRLGNEDDAIHNLKKLLRTNVSSQIKSKAYTTLAMAYTSYDSIKMVISSLAESLKYEFTNPHQKARNLFVLGQLYRQENKIDSSNSTFQKLADYKKAPYRFKIHAILEKVKNYDRHTDNTEQVLSTLEKMSKNRDNRPFLDEIYYLFGKVNLANNQTEKAICRFKEFLNTKIKQPGIQSLVYEELGNYYFDNSEFIKAGGYYDKLLHLNVKKATKRIRSIARKRKSLNEIIRLENISSVNDSILRLVSMSKEERAAFFKTHIATLKKKAEEAKNIAENNKPKLNGNGFGNSLLNTKSNKTVKGGKFYFYNAQTVGFGKAAFKKIWGDRDLVDNWRLSQQKSVIEELTDKKDEKENTKELEKFNLDFYIKQIPTETVTIDSIANERNNAYYQLGVIYKEKFKKDELATKKHEKLLEFFPNKKLIVPTYYNLYKAFESFNMDKSKYYKAKIISDYPESKYAKIINDPTFVVEDDKNVMVVNYELTYRKYLKEEYEAVINACEKYILLYVNTEITPKFELLKAFAFAKKNKDKKAFIVSLEKLVKNYPKTEESKQAQIIIDSLRGKIKAKEEKTKKKAQIKRKKPINKALNRRPPSGPPSLKSNVDKSNKNKKNKKIIIN